MSISISEFKAWATENRGTAVAVNGGALESASNQIGIFDHVFRRGTVDRNILLLKRERSDSHDAYKLAARLAVLSQLIGKVPCWNCKSGKDRTGEMDVECKFLSALIARGEKIPEPGAELTAAAGLRALLLGRRSGKYGIIIHLKTVHKPQEKQ